MIKNIGHKIWHFCCFLGFFYICHKTSSQGDKILKFKYSKMGHWDETDKQVFVHIVKSSLYFPVEKEGHAISRYTIQDLRSQGVSQPWEIKCNVIFPIAFNFPIVSTLIGKVKHDTLENRNYLSFCLPSRFACEKLFSTVTLYYLRICS